MNRLLRRLRHRQPAQIGLVAPFAVVALISVLGIVVDVGIFRVIDSELENAADAAALAAAWYDPVCPGSAPRDPLDPAAADPRCPVPNPADPVASVVHPANGVAQKIGRLNLGLATALCGSTPVIDPLLVHPVQAPNARAVTVIVHCEAGYLAGRIFGLPSTTITRWATAALGEEKDVTEADGRVTRYLLPYAAFPGTQPKLMVRLVPL